MPSNGEHSSCITTICFLGTHSSQLCCQLSSCLLVHHTEKLRTHGLDLLKIGHFCFSLKCFLNVLSFLQNVQQALYWMTPADPWQQGRLRIVNKLRSVQVQSLSCVRLFATPWTAARQGSLSITNSRSLPKPMSIESVMPSNHLIFCHPLLLPSIFPSISHEVMGPDAMILGFWMLGFKLAFSVFSFSFIKRLFSSLLSPLEWYYQHI